MDLDRHVSVTASHRVIEAALATAHVRIVAHDTRTGEEHLITVEEFHRRLEQQILALQKRVQELEAHIDHDGMRATRARTH